MPFVTSSFLLLVVVCLDFGHFWLMKNIPWRTCLRSRPNGVRFGLHTVVWMGRTWEVKLETVDLLLNCHFILICLDHSFVLSFLFSFLPLSLSSSCWSLHLCSFLFRISYDLTNPTEHVAGFLMVARAPRMSLMQGTSPNWRSNGPVTDCRPSSTSTGRIDQPIGATTGAFMASLIVFKATTPECSDPPLGWYFWKLKQWEGTQTHTHNLASYEFLCGCHGSSLDHFQKPIASATWLSCDS